MVNGRTYVLPNYEAYAKLEPLQASQKSRTTWFVARCPRRLTIFFRKRDFSSADTLSLGKLGSFRAASSHFDAWTCWTISFLSGSVSLSTSLREAFPPMLCINDRDSWGPKCASALFKVVCTFWSSDFVVIKVVCQDHQYLVVNMTRGQRTQNSAAVALGNGSLPSRSFNTNAKRNSRTFAGWEMSTSGYLKRTLRTNSIPFCDNSGSISGSGLN